MMGSGKSTLGRQLAERLRYAFVDLDAYIEGREGRSIAQLFEQEGAGKFRELERQALEAVVQEHRQAVIATGGGTPCFSDNMAFINSHGKSIFLDVPAAEIYRRLSASDLAARPLLAGRPAEELRQFIAKTLDARKQFYTCASHTLSGENQTVDGLHLLLNNK